MWVWILSGRGALPNDLCRVTDCGVPLEPLDIFKMLSYSDDFDVVLGSRTNKELIWTGANMGWFMKWGNWSRGQVLEDGA